MQTNLKNFGKGLINAAILFIALYGAGLVHLIPINILNISLGSAIAFLISWAQHSVVTPAGSTLIKHG